MSLSDRLTFSQNLRQVSVYWNTLPFCFIDCSTKETVTMERNPMDILMPKNLNEICAPFISDIDGRQLFLSIEGSDDNYQGYSKKMFRTLQDEWTKFFMTFFTTEFTINHNTDASSDSKISINYRDVKSMRMVHNLIRDENRHISVILSCTIQFWNSNKDDLVFEQKYAPLGFVVDPNIGAALQLQEGMSPFMFNPSDSERRTTFELDAEYFDNIMTKFQKFAFRFHQIRQTFELYASIADSRISLHKDVMEDPDLFTPLGE